MMTMRNRFVTGYPVALDALSKFFAADCVKDSNGNGMTEHRDKASIWQEFAP